MAKGLAHRLYSGEVSYDFVGNRKRWYTFSAILMTVFVVVIAVLGLNLSIDFKGGTEFTVPTRVTSTTADDYRVAVAQLGLPKNDDITVNSIGTEQVRIQMRSLTAEEITTVRQMLAQKAGIDQDDVTHSLIGASWGKQITKKGITALVVFMLLVSADMGLLPREEDGGCRDRRSDARPRRDDRPLRAHRVQLQPGLAHRSVVHPRILAVRHGRGVRQGRENTRDIARQRRRLRRGREPGDQPVLVRSLNTTIIAVLPVGALLFAGQFILGTGPLKDLGLVLFAGMIFGAYSSIFIATPLLVDMKNREPELVEHHERLARRETRAKQRKSEPAAVKTVEDIVETEAASVGVLTRDEYRQLRQQPTRKSRSERKK